MIEALGEYEGIDAYSLVGANGKVKQVEEFMEELVGEEYEDGTEHDIFVLKIEDNTTMNCDYEQLAEYISKSIGHDFNVLSLDGFKGTAFLKRVSTSSDCNCHVACPKTGVYPFTPKTRINQIKEEVGKKTHIENKGLNGGTIAALGLGFVGVLAISGLAYGASQRNKNK